jgi:hypothetical protein
VSELILDLNAAVWLCSFRILVTSESTGLMETITDAVSVHSIKKEAYAKMTSAPSPENAGGVIPSFTLYDHFLEAFGSPNTLQFRKAQDAFMKSLASYSIISYLLQIKDRHNGNILLDKLGHLMRASRLVSSRTCGLTANFDRLQTSILASCSRTRPAPSDSRWHRSS